MTERKAESGRRRIRFGRWGLMENPVGLCVTWRDEGRDMLGDVVECYLREGYAPTHMLKVRHFNGEDAGEVAASAVTVLEPTEADFTHADEPMEVDVDSAE